METKAFKYPRTFHAPFSKGLINDDKMIENDFMFDGKTVEVSIKLDGESATVYADGYHARSLDSRHHPSRAWMKAFIPTIQPFIPEGWRFCFENCYATHSIRYEDLESYAYLLNIWDEKNYCLSLADTDEWVQNLGLTKVKAIAILEIKGNDFSKLEELYEQVVADGQEGIVVRNIESFHYDDFGKNLAKAVRKGHVEAGSEHWSTNWVPNLLKPKI